MDFFLGVLEIPRDFYPHGFCYQWDKGLVWLNVLSDGLIAISYFAIPITLFHFIRKRRDLPFSWSSRNRPWNWPGRTQTFSR